MQGLLENIQAIIQNQHSLAFFAVFLGGLISAASPCVLAAFFFSAVIDIYSGVYPAMKAARLDPIEALKAE